MTHPPPLFPYWHFPATQWAQLYKDNAPPPLSEKEIIALRGFGETVSLKEVEMIYMPLAHLLLLYFEASKTLFSATNDFLGLEKKVPYVIGIAGSVAVGKSTTSRILLRLLERLQPNANVSLMTTDGFLHPNKELEDMGLMDKKGFPKSFRLKPLLTFLTSLKAGESNLTIPLYSHILYDVEKNKTQTIHTPDILIIEGLNLLQTPLLPKRPDNPPFVSDFIDFSIYLDASPNHIKDWYVTRFLSLRQTAFSQKNAYFSSYKDLDDQEAKYTATKIWNDINLVNLKTNIEPTKTRADLILHKDKAHKIDEVWLRKI